MTNGYALAIALALIPTATLAQSPPAPELELHRLYPGFTFLGMKFEGKSGNSVGKVPFDRPYEALTETEQRVVMSAYERLDQGDEPPFPVGGLAALYDPLTKAQHLLLVEGDFSANLQVDAQGDGVAIGIFKSPGPQTTRVVSAVALLTKFKPALCKGVPCTMGFPIRVHFTVD